jgi:hypothetical protein
MLRIEISEKVNDMVGVKGLSGGELMMGEMVVADVSKIISRFIIRS